MQNLTQYNFAEQYGMSIQGRVFIDENDDGFLPNTQNVQELKALALANVEITLTGKDYRQADILFKTTTDDMGLYRFEQLPPSNAQGYTLTQQQPTEYIDGLEVALGQVIIGSKGSNTITTGQLDEKCAHQG